MEMKYNDPLKDLLLVHLAIEIAVITYNKGGTSKLNLFLDIADMQFL